MPRKYNKSKNGSKKTRKSRSKKPLSQREVKAVSSMIKKQMDRQIEDKYLLDGDFHPHVGTYDGATETLLFNVSPQILNGTEVYNRTGNKVRFKYFKTFVRYLPQKKHVQYITDQAPVYASNWIPNLPDVRFYFVRINSKLAQNLTNLQLREACLAKFRMPGKCWQDYAQSTGQESVSAIKLLDKWIMKPKYRIMQNAVQSGEQTGSVSLPTAIMDGAITLNDVNQQETQVASIPQFSYYELNCKAVAQKVEIEDVFNNPIKYQYWIFATLGSGYNDGTYDFIDSPTQVDTRNLWVFEDA